MRWIKSIRPSAGINLLVVIIPLVLLNGCAGCGETLNNRISEKIRNDKKLDEAEYNELKQLIIENQSDYSQFIKEGVFDSEKFNSYLLALPIVKKLNVDEKDIYYPDRKVFAPVKLHAFIENSASMDGYVEGVTDFENSVYNFLSDLKIKNDIISGLNLYYINNTIPFKKTNALPKDIEDFIQKLSPAEFSKKGGQRGVSDIKLIIDTVLKYADEGAIALLVSDFVFSPGSKSAQDYLVAQQIGIKISIDEKIKQGDYSILVLRYTSSFRGIYYDYKNRNIQYNGERPFYIWLIGYSKVIDKIIDARIYQKLVNPPKEMVYFSKAMLSAKLNYKVSMSGKRGDFKFDSASKGKILEDCESASSGKFKGQFGFNLLVDFSPLRISEDYLKNAANYRISDNYTIEKIESIDKDKFNGFTHQIFVKTNRLLDSDIKISLLNNMPDWVSNYSSLDDSNILTDQIEKLKTFGLEYLLSGVYDAFQNVTGNNIITSFNIRIKQ